MSLRTPNIITSRKLKSSQSSVFGASVQLHAWLAPQQPRAGRRLDMFLIFSITVMDHLQPPGAGRSREEARTGDVRKAQTFRDGKARHLHRLLAGLGSD